MKREIESYLLLWKESINRKPLIIRGARQVGKTFTIEKFGRKHFEHFLLLNAEQDNNLAKIFESKNPVMIASELSALYNIPVLEGKTLLFIDEIQLLPEAIASLRYFHEQMPELHIVAAGSLLDHTLNEFPYSMPVGRVEFAYMYPLNFREFLRALNQNGLIKYVINFDFNTPFSKALHQKLLQFLRLYFFIGGMPEAVKIYAETNNLPEVSKVHNSILTSFQYDFAKYGSRNEQQFLNQSLQYAAINIGKKIKYSAINNSVHSSYIKNALLKLEMSRVIHLIRKTKSSKIPINQYVDDGIFKPLFLDIGLVCSLLRIKLTDLTNLITDFEGSLAEQFTGQELLTSFDFFEDAKLYYWIREAKNTNAEIDFLYQINNNIYPVEVKAGKTGTLKSLQVYLAEKKETTGIRFNTDLPSIGENLKATVMIKGEKLQINYRLISLPLYFASLLNKIDSLILD